MKGGLAAAAAVVAALILVPHSVADGAATCGLPAKGPLWIDYAGHNAPIVPKPGMILALSSGTVIPAELRASGAATIFFDLHLNDRIGTPSKPVDPATIPAKARAELAFAQQVTGCATPLIAENELFGAQTPTPWTPTIAQYRANVLSLLQELDALGATTAITIANPPNTGGDAADWWRQAAQASILVRQVYYGMQTPALYKLGPVTASRYMRQWMRALVAHFGEIGIPASRVALELQFQSAPGEGGREGLKPKSAWLDFVKLEALAAKQVASELPLQGVWSWGWPSFSVAGNDSDKAAAACVYFWTRDRRLCDGPLVAGAGFDASLTEGQLGVPAGIRCTLGPAARLTKSDVARVSVITGDRESAATALLQRVVLRAASPVDPVTVLAAERAIVRDRFGGSGSRYRAALASAHVSLTDARAIIADRIARERVQERFKPQPAAPAQLAAFVETYATTQVRLVSVDPEAPWLGDAVRGWAVETIAPDEVFSLPPAAQRTIDTIDGRFRVRVLGPSLPLLALPPAKARDVARGVLGRFAKDAVYERWLHTQQSALLGRAVCARDRAPVNADVDLTAFVPFLGA